MASQLRYRGGVVELVAFPTANDGAVAHSIEVGDLVYIASGVAYPAYHKTDAGNLGANQLAFASAFAGVAVSKVGLQSGETSFKLTTDKGYVLVATTGDFEFPCAATSFNPGDRVGAMEVAAGLTGAAAQLDNQVVAKVATDSLAIGVAKVPYNALGTSMTSVIVSLKARAMLDGVDSGQ
jgi:hypothetical protein